MAAVGVDLGVAHEGIDAVQEIGRVTVGLQPDDVIREQPLADRAAQTLRQHQPRVDGGPWDVIEVQDERVRPFSADGRGGQVEVIVLQQDRTSRSGR